MRAGKTGGADALAAARPVCGAEGSDGCKPSVPEAGEAAISAQYTKIAQR